MYGRDREGRRSVHLSYDERVFRGEGYGYGKGEQEETRDVGVCVGEG